MAASLTDLNESKSNAGAERELTIEPHREAGRPCPVLVITEVRNPASADGHGNEKVPARILDRIHTGTLIDCRI
jgi:hypothetical protein